MVRASLPFVSHAIQLRNCHILTGSKVLGMMPLPGLFQFVCEPVRKNSSFEWKAKMAVNGSHDGWNLLSNKCVLQKMFCMKNIYFLKQSITKLQSVTT